MLYPIITTTGNITVNAGETITQATSGATGVVLRNVSASNSVEITDVTGVFDTTNTLKWFKTRCIRC